MSFPFAMFSIDADVVALFGKSATEFTDQDFLDLKAVYVGCAETLAPVWTSGIVSPERIAKAFDRMQDGFRPMIAEKAAEEDTDKFIEDTRDSFTKVSLAELKARVDERFKSAPDTRLSELRNLQLDIEQLEEQRQKDAINLTGSGHPAPSEKNSIEARLASPDMTRYALAQTVIGFREFCGSYDSSFDDVDLLALTARRDELWTRLALPEDVGLAVRDRGQQALDASMSKMRYEDCGKTRSEANAYLEFVFSDRN
ncbi:hypothetical protein GUK30_32515 [Rhizobium leguminosarum]|uniref:hypothetical protein n=1 Tax=Rhizobium ruizarguesonis TaxID=2081791 RepID=UPI0013BF62F0|nr:hypothetical protein [Rhizobium ruizarguesonis]NEI24071.1 hypothetical protein [Rhizobium ruizarguesonis]